MRTWEEERPGERYQIVVAEYYTPRGRMRHAVRKAPGWPFLKGGVSLFSDLNPPRAAEHPIKTEQDLDVLEYLFEVPGEAMLSQVTERARRTRRNADERDAIVQGHCTTGGDSMAWLCGFDQMIYFAVDDPAFVRRLLDIIHRNEMRRLEMMLDLEVADIIVRRAWYESLRSVSMRIYRDFLAPLIREEAALTHQVDLLYMYICTADIMGLVPTWKEIGVDVIWGVDPVQGDADLTKLKSEADDQLSFWGGINSWVTLQGGTNAEIREAVGTAIRTMGPGGGFVLLPVDAIGAGVTPHAMEVLTNAWKACADYPLSGRALGTG